LFLKNKKGVTATFTSLISRRIAPRWPSVNDRHHPEHCPGTDGFRTRASGKAMGRDSAIRERAMMNKA